MTLKNFSEFDLFWPIRCEVKLIIFWKVWNYILKNREASVGKISQETKVVIPTVKQVINKLLKLKKIEMIGLGRAVRYRLK